MGENFTAFLLGQAVRRSMGAVKTPVAYLYNGARLPKLPDEDGYPYSVIVDADGVYLVDFSTYKQEAYNTGHVGLSPGGKAYKYADGQWVKTSWITFPNLYPLIWTNYDLHYKTVDSYGELSGKLYMPESAPIPVYE